MTRERFPARQKRVDGLLFCLREITFSSDSCKSNSKLLGACDATADANIDPFAAQSAGVDFASIDGALLLQFAAV